MVLLINSKVLSNGQQRLEISIEVPSFTLVFFKAAYMSPVNHPTSIRAMKQVTKAPKGLMLSRMVPNAFNPKHRIKLVAPNTPPKIAPALGPSVMAPTATGTTIRVISTAKTLM